MSSGATPGETLLGKYRVERVLGRGGMGMVVAARHEGLGELFAIKLMLKNEGDGTQARERFLREARNAVRLKSEHVAKVHDVGLLDDGRPYMIMEYLEGRDLAAQVKRRGPLAVADAAGLVLQACDALIEAHALGIVHRDIKPSNMFLIRRPNGKPCLKLLDFGISKRINADTKELTASGATLGSPFYMSPEQLTDPKSVGPQSDIWAMGVVLYELTTGKTPFDGEVLGQVALAILNRAPDPPSAIRADLPSELDEVVLRCLRKNPEERYATMKDFASAVRSLLRVNSALSPLSDLLGEREDEALRALSAELTAAPTAKALERDFTEAPSEEARYLTQAETLSEPPPATEEMTPTRLPEELASTQSPMSRTMAEAASPPKRRAPLAWIGVAAGCLVLIGVGAYVFQVKPSVTPASALHVKPEIGAPIPLITSAAPPAAALPSAAVSAPSAAASSASRAPLPGRKPAGTAPPAATASAAPAAPAPKPTGSYEGLL